MSHDDDAIVLAGWARSAVVPVDGAFAALTPHALGAPVIQAALARAGIPGARVDAVVAGNALGANGNPARMLALAAGLPERCAAYSIDSQCCAGLDAVTLGASLIASGAASVVVAGGVEAWSRAPIRAHRPLRGERGASAGASDTTDGHAGRTASALSPVFDDAADAADDRPQPYDRPAFAPDPARDPDLFAAAADYARQRRWSRVLQDAYAIEMHLRAHAHAAGCSDEIVSIAAVDADRYPRILNTARAARMPLAMRADGRIVVPNEDDLPYAQSRIAVSPRADGAAFVVLTRAGAHAVAAMAGHRNARTGSDDSVGARGSADGPARPAPVPRLIWRGGLSLGGQPEQPMLAAGLAAEALLARHRVTVASLHTTELHDAFAAQALAFAERLGMDPLQLNRRGGGIARGHPIGASGAIALVRVLSDLACAEAGGAPALGLAAIAGAGGLGAAALVARVD